MGKNNEICCLFFNQPGKENIFVENMNNKISTFCVLKKVGFLSRVIRRLHLKSGLPGIQIWFTDWYKKIDNYKIVVCVATDYSIPILRWIYKNIDKKIKLINYYWDEIHISGYPVINDSCFENWSFNKENCVEFNMKYNPQFWIRSMDLTTDQYDYDVSYIAADRNGAYKERTLLVNYLYDLLKNKEYNIFFWYESNSEQVNSEIRQQTELTQRDFLEYIKKSKVIIEITEGKYPWFTQRTLYALSNKKKLITNNFYIKNEPIYDKRNVFLLGEDNIELLDDFLNTPFCGIKEEILNEYELDAWINRFY